MLDYQNTLDGDQASSHASFLLMKHAENASQNDSQRTLAQTIGLNSHSTLGI